MIARLSSLILGSRLGPDWDALAMSAARALPADAVWRLFELAVHDVCVALCLHRVSRTRRDRYTIDERELDEFVERASAIHHRLPGPWLSITFDDGYEDAARFIESRAPRHSGVEWMLFVCPEKAENQAGFRWDLGDSDATPFDILRENSRPDLKDVAQRLYRVAGTAHCKELAQLSNVRVGNHTNCHFRALDLPLEQIGAELRQSHEDFTRLFGPITDFAFPFGAPEQDFDARHVGQLRALGDFHIWTTARRPYLSAHRFPGAVLPRFPVCGEWSAKEIAFWIALLSLRGRLRGFTPLYPAERPETARDTAQDFFA
jgi:peptidoglycan/xylan/chitin deacetylase (PgdA/CDA1 family)